MKEIYHLSIDITEGDVHKSIHAYYEDHARGKKELDRWARVYKEKWQVPDEPNDVWIDTKGNFLSNYHYIGRPQGKPFMFYGSLFGENYILEEGDEIQEVSGCVFRYTEFPSIYGYNCGPWLVGDSRVNLRDLIDVERKVRIYESIVSKEGVERVSPEEEERYYNIRAEIIHDSIYKKK